MIGPMVAPLVHFLGMVWFQVYGGSQCYSREWVWNLRTKLCWKVAGKGVVSIAPLWEFCVGYMMFYVISVLHVQVA